MVPFSERVLLAEEYLTAGCAMNIGKMVAVSKLLQNGLLLATQNVFLDVATPEQASVEQWNIIKYLGGLGPYMQHPGYGISTEVPEGCKLEQVHLLSRHGERYPQKDKGADYKKTYDKLMEHKKPFVGELAFLNDYEFFGEEKYYEKETTNTNSEGLYAGTSDAMRHGTEFRARYGTLYNQSATPLVVFTSNSGRVHVTAEYFARGFMGSEYRENDTILWNVISEEAKRGANSLTPDVGCDIYKSSMDLDTPKKFNHSFYHTAAKRITEGNDGIKLNETDIDNLYEWCAFETNVRGSSPVCTLFTNDEFVRFSYTRDLLWYYQYGPGNNASHVVGKPFWEATVKHLKEEDPENKLVLMFAHDSQFLMLHASLGMYFLRTGNGLPTDHIPFPKPYAHAEFIPMGARSYLEKYTYEGTPYVRFIINDAVIPIDTCQDGPGFSCSLDDFEAYVEHRMQDVDYKQQCHNANDKLTFLWDYKQHRYWAPDINA